MSRHKLTNNKMEQDFKILNCRIDSKGKRIYISSNHSNNNMSEHKIEQQKIKIKENNSIVISNVDNNIIEREIKIINSSNGSKDKSDCTLKNTVENVTMTHSIKLKNKNIESNHVDNITMTHKFTTLNNRNESKIKRTTNYNDNSNKNTTNHEIDQQKTNREPTNTLLYKYRNKVNTNIKEHDFEK